MGDIHHDIIDIMKQNEVGSVGTLYSHEPDLFFTGRLWIGDYKCPPIDKRPAEKLGLVHETRDFVQRINGKSSISP